MQGYYTPSGYKGLVGGQWMMFPTEAEELFQAAEKNAQWRYNGYRRLSEMKY